MGRTWADRDKLFPEFLTKGFTRDDLTKEREKEFVNFCFEAYEADGFKDTFGTPYVGERNLVGKKFKVVGRTGIYPDEANGADLECLPMWNIQFEDGMVMAAYPEEICKKA